MRFPHSPAGGAAGGAEPILAERARELADRVARPTAAARDRERRWDPAVFAALADPTTGPGLAGPLVPRALGGGGLSATQTCALLEGLGEGARDPGLALAVGVHAVLATVPLRAFGDPRQRRHYLPRMASGEWTGALSLRQTQGAALTPTVTARPDPAKRGGWLLAGELDLVAGAPVAHHFLVIAAHPDGSRTAFVVDRTTPALTVQDTGPTAMATCPWGRLVLDDSPVPDHAVLGTTGAAATQTEPLLAALDWVFSSAPWLGAIRALTRDAIGDARERHLFGRPLAHGQSTRFTLADLGTRYELAAGLLYRAAGQFDAGGHPSQQDAAAARLFTAQAARTVTQAAADLSGPLPPAGDHLTERAHRDALFFAGTGGGTEVLRPVIAASLLGLG
ncbi:acyl-CoA dehydrogenase family protein [Streptomyces sp. NPDC058655]|uniref:acyl-CoA dehydrogenase family protein n=1 Tax=unclassified Streptomyces TaxID=2593676 RepID=UPI00365C7A71